MTIQLKAVEQYFPLVLFIMMYNVVLSFESVKKSYSVTIQMKSTKQYLHVVLFTMLFKVNNTHLPSTAERSDYNGSIPRSLILMSILSNL